MEKKPEYFGGGYVREWLISHYDFSLPWKLLSHIPFRSAFTPLLSRCLVGDVSHEKKPSYFLLYWMVNRDPYNGLL